MKGIWNFEDIKPYILDDDYELSEFFKVTILNELDLYKGDKVMIDGDLFYVYDKEVTSMDNVFIFIFAIED